MKKNTNFFVAIFILNFIILTQFSCNNNTEGNDILPVYLETSFPLLELKHEQYFQLDNDSRSIEIVFNDDIVKSTVEGNIILSDKNGSLIDNYKLITDGKLVTIRFIEGFNLQGGWKYNLKINENLLSLTGFHVKENMVVELRTLSRNIHDQLTGYQGGTSNRTLIACISDIHCGDQRAIDGNYSWFNKNAVALADYLDYVKNHPKIKQLVIMGDLFDEWMVPYNRKPFDSAVNITNSKEYFKAIAGNSTNKPIFDKLSEISNGGIIDVIYIPGNHDMLVTQDVIEELIPNVQWMSDAQGLGKYNPVDKIHMEHGHRFDFFNCPQSLINEGQLLPPGYFVTRLYASGLATRNPSTKEVQSVDSDIEFITAWSAAFGYTISKFNLDIDTIPMNSTMVKMTGIDGYFSDMTFDSALAMYDADIEELWKQTQVVNQVPNSLSVFLAILNGTYLYGAALYEYLADYFATDQPLIVAFGHSHEPEINVFPSEIYYTGIYANSGSWIDPSESKYNTRTFLIINPALWSGSELDVVSLYQYNVDSDSGSGDYKPYMIKEESIKNK